MKNKVIKFGADWCGTCATYKNEWDRAVAKLDLDEWDIVETQIGSENQDELDLALTYGVKSLPTTVIVTEDDVKILHGLQTVFQLEYELGLHEPEVAVASIN